MRKLLPKGHTCERIGCKKSTLYKLISEGKFPKPIKLGRLSLWDSNAVDAFIEKAIADGKVNKLEGK